MAKSSADNINARIIALESEAQAYVRNQKEAEKLYKLEEKITQAQFDRIEALEAENKALAKSKKNYDTLLKVQKEREKSNKAELSDYQEMDTNLISIGNTIGKNTKAYKLQSERLEKTKIVLDSISKVITKNGKINDSDYKSIQRIQKAYKQNQASIIEANRLRVRGNITTEEYHAEIKKARDTYAEIRSEIELSTEAEEAFGQQLKNMDAEVKSFGKASAEAFGGLQRSIDGIAGSGVEGMRELGDVMKTATNGGKGLSLALGALAGVLAGMAYNYGLIGNKLGTIAGYDKKIAKLTGEIDTINKQVDMGMFGGRNFVMEEAMLDFSASVQQMGASFEAASKTALFGNKLGSVGYGAAQLQLAGISADKIAQAMQDAADATGKMPSGKVAADMAIIADRTGQSTESIASINDVFQRLDKVSESTALNLQEGVRSMASKAGVNLAGAMTEIAEASKDAISYQIKSTSQLAKQVIYAKSLGVSFNAVAKAGQNMVLNYKDSIKAEMSLSAMLGKSVNLSEVRTKFMSGDSEGAMKALQAQGLDPAKMNMFQQQQLSSALGGMDLNDIQKITQRNGTTGGELTGKSVESGNKTYLAAKQSAEAGLAAANAQIQAATELKRIGLNAAAEMQRQDAIINNVGKLADKMNERDQQSFLKNAETMLTTALISTIAAVVTTFLMNKGGSLLKNVFKSGEKVAPKVTEKVATKTTEKAVAKTTEKAAAKTATKTTTKVAEKTTAKAVEKTTAKIAEKSVAKVATKTFGKSLAKRIPILGSVLGMGFAIDRAMSGDWAGAGLETLSAGAGLLDLVAPGVGTASSMAIDAGIAARDMGAFGGATPASAAAAAKPVEKGTKPTVDAINANGQKQAAAQQAAVEKAKIALTEAQYNTKLQQEIVAMLGVNAQFLQQISTNTATESDININGKVLQTSLLNQARRNYGVSRFQ
jgi:hypothetical protein